MHAMNNQHEVNYQNVANNSRDEAFVEESDAPTAPDPYAVEEEVNCEKAYCTSKGIPYYDPDPSSEDWNPGLI